MTNVLTGGTVRGGDGTSTISPEEITKLFADYRKVEVLSDGRIREAVIDGDVGEETVTRTLKTDRTWY